MNHGQIRGAKVALPRNARGYIVLPEPKTPHAQIYSPRLAQTKQAADFAKQIHLEVADHAER